MVLYFVEVGLALIIAPWTQFWDRNYFVEAWPMTEGALTSPAVRGAVTGVGLVSLWAAVMETAAFLRRRRELSTATVTVAGGGPPPANRPTRKLHSETLRPSS